MLARLRTINCLPHWLFCTLNGPANRNFSRGPWAQNLTVQNQPSVSNQCVTALRLCVPSHDRPKRVKAVWCISPFLFFFRARLLCCTGCSSCCCTDRSCFRGACTHRITAASSVCPVACAAKCQANMSMQTKDGHIDAIQDLTKQVRDRRWASCVDSGAPVCRLSLVTGSSPLLGRTGSTQFLFPAHHRRRVS